MVIWLYMVTFITILKYHYRVMYVVWEVCCHHNAHQKRASVVCLQRSCLVTSSDLLRIRCLGLTVKRLSSVQILTVYTKMYIPHRSRRIDKRKLHMLCTKCVRFRRSDVQSGMCRATVRARPQLGPRGAQRSETHLEDYTPSCCTSSW